LHFLRMANAGTGNRVLIYGASSAVGTSAVQLAKHFGASVTAVCGPTNLDLVRSLGADSVLDYTKQDTVPESKRFDAVFDAVGKRKSSVLKLACKSSLAPGGRYISIGSRKLLRRTNTSNGAIREETSSSASELRLA